MSSFSQFCLASLVCAVIAAGALVAETGADLGVAAQPVFGTAGAGAIIALNPQPLPPGYRDDGEDEYFRG